MQAITKKDDNKNLISDMHETKLEIVESKKETRSRVLCTVEGTFATYGKVNENNRLYEKELWESAIQSEYVQSMMENATLFGEADHPEDRFEIHFPSVSHAIRELRINEREQTVEGKADILDTPNGIILNTLIEYGASLGISARAAGTLETVDGYQKPVKEDYTLYTFDMVPNPGFKSARLTPVNEAKEISFEESLKNQLDRFDEAEIRVAEKVLRTVNPKLYEELINKSEEGKSLNSGDTFSVLEKAHRKIYSLEKRVEELQEKLDDSSGSEDNTFIPEDERKLKELGPEILVSEVKLLEQMLSETSKELRKVEKVYSSIKENSVPRDKLKASKSEAENLRNELSSLEEKVTELENDLTGKDKTISQKEDIIEVLEGRLDSLEKENISEVKQTQQAKNSRIKELKEGLQESISLIEERDSRLSELENFVVEYLAGKTGLSENYISANLPADFEVKKIREYLKKFEKEASSDSSSFDKIKSISLKESKNSSHETDRLSSLVSRVGGGKKN